MILVTGATGHIGRRVTELLLGRNEIVRVMVRDRSRAPRVRGLEVVTGDYSDGVALRRAFDGITTAFVASVYGPPGDRARLHRRVFEAAARADVAHLVYLSFQGASPDSRFPMSVDHFLSEQSLDASGVPHTVLRDSLYMDLLPEWIGPDGVLRGPGGDGKVAWVAREDVAQVVAFVLHVPPRQNGQYDVTGRESLSLEETVQRLSTLVGRPLRYQRETEEEGRAWRMRLGAPAWEVETWLGTYLAIAAGELERRGDGVFRYAGHPAMRLEEYFRARQELLEPLLRVGAEQAHDLGTA